MIRRKKENQTEAKMTPGTTSTNRRTRQGKLTTLVIVICSAVIAYTARFLFASTFDSFEESSGLRKRNKGSPTSFSDSISAATGVASDKTYISESNRTSDCDKFDHGDTSPTPGITSLFNCNSKEGRCKWHYPAKFFDPFCGVGKKFVHEVKTLQKMHENKTLWIDGPPIVIPWASLNPGVNAHQFRKEPYPVHNLSMTHVHKTGGTSLVNAFGALIRYAKGRRHLVYQPNRSRMPKVLKNNPKFKPIGFNESKSYIAVDKFLNGAVKYRSEWGTFDHTLFAVIRDPAERFISAIGQATGAFGSSTNGVGKQLLNECLKKTSKETLSCFVDLVHTKGTLIEVHFTPMVLEISFATIWKDIPVAVFPFQEVPSLLNELGANPKEKKKDGHKEGYRKDPILTNMTSADYDVESLTKLCKIYWVDVLFLNHIGYESNCDWMLEALPFPGIKEEEKPRPVSL